MAGALAIFVATFMVLGAFGGLAGIAHPGTAGGAGSVPSSVPSVAASSALPAQPSPPAVTANVGGACRLVGGSSAAPSSAAVHPPLASAHPSGGPLYNSQVEPYASFTGPYAYVAGGAALRDQGYGNITLSWPDDDALVQAYMVWSIMDNITPPASATLNGVGLMGTWTAYATPSPCWAPTYIYTFVADVTDLVANGVNALTGFPSSVTNGLDPWAEPPIAPMDEGATLVAIYSAGTLTTQQVTLYTGALTSDGQALYGQLNYTKTNSPDATTSYIVADGQLPGNPAGWNGSIIDSNAFPGSAPRSSTAPWSYGNLWDTDTFSVDVSVGGDNTTAEVASSGEDCLTWIGQVVSVGVAAQKGPYAVDFEEEGLPVGQEWNVTTDSLEQSGTVTDAGSSIDYALANGTYPYTVQPISGWVAEYKGSFAVDGGPLYLRIAFHPAVYTITFSETGLPLHTDWSIGLTNTSQGISLDLFVSSPASIVAEELNGSYHFIASSTNLYAAHPASGAVVVASAGVVQEITFVPPPLYNITFVQHGLPSGTTWGGQLDSNWEYITNSTSQRSYLVALPNVTADGDHLLPSSVDGFFAPYVVYFGVFGAPETVDVNYTTQYAVNLIESGLPTDTPWHGNLTGLSGTLYGYSENATITFLVENGSFTYLITHVWGYDAAPSTGPATVDGANVTIRIAFSSAPEFVLTLSETGLPTGTSWTVDVYPPSYVEQVETSTTPSTTINEPNGTYHLDLVVVAGYQGTPLSATVVVTGADASQAYRFTPVYKVALHETGLPSGTFWYGYINDTYQEVDSSTMSMLVTNGSIPFQLYEIGTFEPTPISGSIAIDGANAVEPVVFASATEPTYTVTISETGLPDGTNWSAELNDYLNSTTSSSLTFVEPNGSWYFYAYDVAEYTPVPQDGSIVVSGSVASQAVVYSEPATSYSVTFTESGLPEETEWEVEFNEVSQSSSGTTDDFSAYDGTYPYVVDPADGYTPFPSSGEITVSGEDASLSIVFSAPSSTYTVTFTETGLPTGTTWWINLTEEEPASSATTMISLSLGDGSYPYTATSDDHLYTAHGGTVTVSGETVSVTVHFSTGSSSSSAPGLLGLPGSDGYVVIGGIAAFLLLCLFIVLARRKKNESEGPAPGTGAGAPPPPPAP
ncbi:MAG: hypothetical protein WAK40_01060 [Thermoplasmata archaeon]